MKHSEQIPLIALERVRIPPPVWQRIAAPPRFPRLLTYWIHLPSGWEIHHCGHPTANFPYYIVDADGRTVLNRNGRGFQRLHLAQEHLETIARQDTSKGQQQ